MSESLFDKVVGFQVCGLSANIVKFLRTLILNLNSRVLVFQENLALPVKRNGLTSGIFNLVELV